MGSSTALNAPRRLKDKVAIITGGSSGIGVAACKVFAKHGATVVIADIQDEAGEKLAQELGAPAIFVHCDVTNESDVKALVDTTVEKFGKLDIMYNNAGIGSSRNPNVIEIEKSEFERLMAVNVIGPFLGAKHAARVMIPNRYGSIIMTASTCSRIGGVSSHSYTASKHAVEGLAKNLAIELGKYKIRVNCVSPHLVATPQAKIFYNWTDEDCKKVYSNLKGVQLQSEDVAEAALYLVSDESKYVSGHNLFVDGGFTIVNPRFCMWN